MSGILVIDDDVSMCQLIKVILESKDYQVRTAHDVARAWELIDEERPDVIYCDLMMPDVNGIEFLTLRQEDPALVHVPVVVITGVGRHDWLEEAERLGASAILRKPFKMSDLVSAIESASVPADAGEP